jgi:hypothetical protein
VKRTPDSPRTSQNGLPWRSLIGTGTRGGIESVSTFIAVPAATPNSSETNSAPILPSRNTKRNSTNATSSDATAKITVHLRAVAGTPSENTKRSALVSPFT